MKRMGWALALGAACWALPAQAQLVRAQDPGGVAAAMKAAGYPATLGTDKLGDPMITGQTGNTGWQLFFYNCTEHKDCATVQFHAGYDFEKPLDMAVINDWNRTQRFGRAYLDDENDPILEMDVDLDDGGLSPALFIDNVEFWNAILPKFEERIGFKP